MDESLHLETATDRQIRTMQQQQAPSNNNQPQNQQPIMHQNATSMPPNAVGGMTNQQGQMVPPGQMMQTHSSQLPPGAGGMGMLPPEAASMMQMNPNAPQGMQGAPYGYVNSLIPPQHFMQHPHVAQPGCNIPNKARIQCHACGKLLEYDAGAQYVQCFSCSTMNAVQQRTQLGGRVLSMLCAMCGTTNLAPYGINYIRCGNCHTISQVSHAYRQDPTPQTQPQAPQHRVELSHGEP